MVYAYDLWAQLPVKDLYDTLIMLAAVNVAKDMYEKGEQAIKDFRKDYGDFMSPNENDVRWYNLNFNVADKLGEIYSRGGDPLRNQADRAEVYRWINSRPYAQYNERKLQAANMQKYLENVAKADMEGEYSAPFEQSILGFRRDGTPITVLNWDMNQDGTWKRLAPAKYQSLDLYTDNIFSGMEDEFIETDPATGMDIFGISPERRSRALDGAMSSILSTPLGKYHYQNSRNNALAILGRTPTEAETMDQFRKDILSATSKYDKRDRRENPEYKRRREFVYADRLDASRTTRDIAKEKALRANTPGYDSKGNAIPGYSKNGDKSTNIIFREAEANADYALHKVTTKSGKSVTYSKVGEHVLYTPGTQYSQHIDPVNQASYVLLQDENKVPTECWRFDSNTMLQPGAFYKLGEDGKMHAKYLQDPEQDSYTFVPDGNMRSQKTSNGYRYYVSGTFMNSKISGTRWVEVKERYGNYGETLKKY